MVLQPSMPARNLPLAERAYGRADVPPLHLFTTFKGTKFEFVFTPLTRAQSHLLLQTADLLLRSFNASARFREVRMRGAHPPPFVPRDSRVCRHGSPDSARPVRA